MIMLEVATAVRQSGEKTRDQGRIGEAFNLAREALAIGVESASERVVQRAPIAKGFMDRRVETIENPKLELIRAFEEILHIGEGKDDVGDTFSRGRGQALARGVVGCLALHVLRHVNIGQEFRGALEELVAWDRGVS